MIIVDIGNTSLNYAIVKKEKIIKISQLKRELINEEKIKAFLNRYPKENFLICSVVPQITKTFKKFESKERKILVAGKDLKVPIKCFYNPKKIGMDRLVGALAAKKLYPFSRIIIDCGTAITFDFLSKRGDYLGGMVLPGIGSTLKAFSCCALLPKKIKLKDTKRIIPKETDESISKGIKEGFSLMLNSLVKKYKKILKLSYKEIPIITGGDALLIMPYLDFSYLYQPNLVLKGLYILSKNLTF
jgi:type III pantothenate kinase